MTEYHLAQLNIAHAIDELESPVMQGFTSRLDEINSLAEQSDGFVWRLVDNPDLLIFDDERIIVNLSVWQSVEALKAFVYKTVHVELLKNKKAWFHKMPETHQVFWWVEKGHQPTVQEAKEKLMLFREQGATEKAFTLARPFTKPSSN